MTDVIVEVDKQLNKPTEDGFCFMWNGVKTYNITPNIPRISFEDNRFLTVDDVKGIVKGTVGIINIKCVYFYYNEIREKVYN